MPPNPSIDPSIDPVNTHPAAKATDARFEEFWKAYPRKKEKKPCRDLWKRKKLDAQADAILADIERRKATDHSWRITDTAGNRAFVVYPIRYLGKERWHDDIEPLRLPEPPTRNKHQQSMDRLQAEIDRLEAGNNEDREHDENTIEGEYTTVD